MKKMLIPAFCLWHMFVVFWWSLPYSFADLVINESDTNAWEAKFIKFLALDQPPLLTYLFKAYIDISGHQQYWDFFAPQSPNYHQYLSVCGTIITDSVQQIINCREPAWFSNLDADFATAKFFGSYRSRLYRLTENLGQLKDPFLSSAFATYFQSQQAANKAKDDSVYLVLHQFELHPELKDLPKTGYRMDQLIWSRH
jgi:hypothetical protein